MYLNINKFVQENKVKRDYKEYECNISNSEDYTSYLGVSMVSSRSLCPLEPSRKSPSLAKKNSPKSYG